jgi:hypothetical protein
MQDVPKIVRQQLKASTPASTSTAELHPDADLLTAFAEHALASAERASLVEHLARCGDCRDVVALALPANETVVIPASRGVRAGSFSLPILRWGVVAAGLLAVTSVGVQQYKRHHPEQIVASNVTASNVAQSKATLDTAAQNVQALAQTPAPVNSNPSAPEPQTRKKAMAALPAQARVAEGVSAQAQPTFASSSSAAVRAQPDAAQTTAQNQIQDQLIQNQKELPLNGRNVTNVDTVAKAKDPVPATASTSPVAAADMPLQTSSAMVGVSPRWAISRAGTLQHSLDDGQTWQDINPAAASPNAVPVFRAVAAAGLEVWAGGSASALYHTIDGGSHWTLVLPSAAGAILTGDITSIQFPDSQHGTVATSTTEVWITTDDGQTWHKQQ